MFKYVQPMEEDRVGTVPVRLIQHKELHNHDICMRSGLVTTCYCNLLRPEHLRC